MVAADVSLSEKLSMILGVFRCFLDKISFPGHVIHIPAREAPSMMSRAQRENGGGWWRHFRNLLSSRLLFHSDPFTNGGQPFKCADTLTDSIWKHWQLCSNSSENSLFVPCSGNFKLMWRLTIVAYDCVIKNLRLVSLFWRKCFSAFLSSFLSCRS